jgi:hypothetical protein
MTIGDTNIPFPFYSIVLQDVPNDSEYFDSILKGEGDLADFEFGYCVAHEKGSDQKRYLLFFQRKPYAAGVFSDSADITSTTIRDFFVHLAQHPKIRLFFMLTDPVLIKSILVLQECVPETKGSAEFLRIENQVVGLMEGRKDALVVLVQDGRYSLAFAKGGKVVRAYFYDQFVEASGGMEWLDLFRKIENYQIKGQQIRIQIYENMQTTPADDYIEGDTNFPGGIFKHYTRPLPELIVRDKVRTLKRISVHKFPFVVGRSEEADLVLGDSGVSRQHAAFEEKDEKLVIRDLGSTNGIFVNGHFTKEFALQDGDRVSLGTHILQVVLPRSPAEDVQLVSSGSQDVTMAMDRESRVKVTCAKCGAAGTIDSERLYSRKNTRIRCPNCKNLFDIEKQR